MHISGKEFKASTLNDLDYVELDEYVQYEMICIARKSAMNLPTDERQETIQAAIKASAGIRWSSAEGSRILTTHKGMMRLGYQMVTRNHKRLTFDEFLTLAFSKGREGTFENVKEIDRVYVKLNTLAEENAVATEQSSKNVQ